MIQVVKLFGYLPNMLELTCNTCSQGCTYCYAKNWKKENHSVDRIVNDILRKEAKKEGLLPWLIRKRSPITISNRSDIMCAPNWREYLSAIKKLGFPIYLETKLTKEYKDLVGILDPKTDYIYQTITGFNNKYEEKNKLTNEEKIEAGKWLAKRFTYCLAVNPYMPDKVTLLEVKKLIKTIKPAHFIMRGYHLPSVQTQKKFFRPEYPKDQMKADLLEMCRWCDDNNIVNDIDGRHNLLTTNPELNAKFVENDVLFGGNHFVFQKVLPIMDKLLTEDDGCDVVEMDLESFKEIFKKEIKYFSDCVFTPQCYTGRYRDMRSLGKTFGINDFIKYLWNNRTLTQILGYWTDEKDKYGNLIYKRGKEDVVL